MSDGSGVVARRAQAAENVAHAREFWDRAINRRDARGAQSLLSADFVHHEPDIAPGAAGFVAHLETLPTASPGLSIEAVRHIADGDFVVCHHRRVGAGADIATIDIVRLDGGRIAEWWHVFQPVPEKIANPNGMF